MQKLFARKITVLALCVFVLSAVGGAWGNMAGSPATGPLATRPSIKGNAVIIGDHPLSATAAFKILEKGGNAFDAAVAMAATMSLVYPSMNDFFGGDAMIIVYSAKDKKVITYNGSGWAPEAATMDRYIEAGGIPEMGILSVEIPGSFGGWMKLLQDYGTLPLKEILAPSIHLAENGFEMPNIMAYYLNNQAVLKNLNEAANMIYQPDGKTVQAGDMVCNKNYAKTLKSIMNKDYKEAEDYFYRGPIAEAIVAYSQSVGGLLSLKDFQDFQAEKVDAVSTDYRGVDVFACPPNSQGMVLLEALNILEGYDLKALGHNSAQYIDLLMQACNLALEDRNRYLGDPRFVDNPMGLITKEYAKVRREKDMTPGKPMGDELVKGNPSEFNDVYYGKTGDTTFMAIADAEGNIVACTTSLCGAYGSGMMVPGAGIMLNNRMTYFFLEDTYPNYLQPRKRTMQTITPSIALKEGKPYLAFGTPGADVQEQAKLQVFLNTVEFGMDPQIAVEAPRAQSRHPMGLKSHLSYPRTLQVEGRVPRDARDELEKMGYTLQTKADWEYLGYMGMIVIDAESGRKKAGADPRSDSMAIGW